MQPGDIIMHTWDLENGLENGEGNILWTATNIAFLTISGGVWEASFLGRGNHWTLSVNSTVLTEGDIFDGDPYSRAAPFDFANGTGGTNALRNISVWPGDTIKLQITKTSHAGDMVGINFTVAASDQPLDGPPALHLQLYPGILLYGAVGTNYRVDYISGVYDGGTNWTTLTNLTLPSSPFLIIDPQPATSVSRFYRAVVIP
jgi:hypothetical protein